MMENLLDILINSIGHTPDGKKKCGIEILKQKLLKDDTWQAAGKTILTSAEIDVLLSGDFIMFDIIWSNATHFELRRTWNMLCDFKKTQESLYEKDEEIVLSFSVIPTMYEGQYFYTLANPIFWALQPSNPNGPNNMIRLLFLKESLNIFEGEKVDMEEIQKELEREQNERVRMMEMELQKQKEAEDRYQKQMDARRRLYEKNKE